MENKKTYSDWCLFFFSLLCVQTMTSPYLVGRVTFQKSVQRRSWKPGETCCPNGMSLFCFQLSLLSSLQQMHTVPLPSVWQSSKAVADLIGWFSSSSCSVFNQKLLITGRKCFNSMKKVYPTGYVTILVFMQIFEVKNTDILSSKYMQYIFKIMIITIRGAR